jgi:hypothetical protein
MAANTRLPAPELLDAGQPQVLTGDTQRDQFVNERVGSVVAHLAGHE